MRVPFKETINYEYSCLKNDYDPKAESMLLGTDMIKSADDIYSEKTSADQLSKIPIRCRGENNTLRNFKLETVCPGWLLNVCNIKYNFWCATIKTIKYTREIKIKRLSKKWNESGRFLYIKFVWSNLRIYDYKKYSLW